MLKRAANAEEKSLSAFVIDKSIEVAAEILADRCSFVLSARHYDAVIAGLDTAPQSLSRLEAPVRRIERAGVKEGDRMTFTLLPGTEVRVRVKNKSATMRRLRRAGGDL